MINHVWTVLCSKSLIDQETNNISLFEVIEQVRVRAILPLPESGLAPAHLELVTLWTRSDPDTPTRGFYRVNLSHPRGTRSISQLSQIDLREFHRVRSRAMIEGIPVTGPGTYTFEVELQQEGEETWNQVAKVPVDIQVETTTPQDVQQPPTS